MAESPVLTVARLLGGVVLLNGNLGHQILGQLLITDSNEVAIAGAAAAVAATSGQQNAAAQIAIRTAVPALAVRGLLLKQEQRIERREKLLFERERELASRTQANAKTAETIKSQKTQIEQAIIRETALRQQLAVLEAEKTAAASTITALDNRTHDLETEIGAFRTDVVRQSGLNIDDSYRPPPSAGRKSKTSKPGRTRKRKPKGRS